MHCGASQPAFDEALFAGAEKPQGVSHSNQGVAITSFPKLRLKIKQLLYFPGRCWRAPCPDRAKGLLPITCLVGSMILDDYFEEKREVESNLV